MQNRPARDLSRVWPVRARLALLCCFGALLLGCSALEKPAPYTVYDFGPALVAESANTAGRPVVLATIEASSAMDGNAIQYRLGYADAQLLLPYAQARWSMPPAQLLRQRLRAQLAKGGPVLNPGDGLARGGNPLLLRLEIEEFSQLFDSPTSSRSLLRVRAQLLETAGGREQLLDQRVLVLQRPAPSADAAGGVRALAAASDALADELTDWLKPRR